MSSIIDGNNDLSNRVMTSSRPSSAIDPKFFHDTSIVLMSPVSSSRRTSIGNLYDIPYVLNHKLLLNTNRSLILTIHKDRNKEVIFVTVGLRKTPPFYEVK